MLPRINLQTKLFFAFLVPTSISLIGLASSSGTINRLMHSTTHLSQTSLIKANGLWKMIEGRSQIAAAQNALLQHELSPQERTIALTRIEKAWTQINQGMNQAFRSTKFEGTLQLEQTFLWDWQQWKQSHENFLAKERIFYQFGISDPHQEQANLSLKPFDASEAKTIEAALKARQQLLDAKGQESADFQATEYPLTSLLNDSQKIATQIQQNAAEEVTIAQRWVGLLMILIPVTAGTVAWVLSRSIAQPLDQQIHTMIKDLEAAKDTLEEKVQERTQELEQTLQDLTQTQLQLVQAEKMSSLGELVAGVAHEINNPVSFIHGNLSYLKEYTDQILDFLKLYQKHYPKPVAAIQTVAEESDLDFIQSDLRKILGSMKSGTERIREIVLSLRNFSRLDEAEFKAVDLHEGIESTLLILCHRLKESADRPEILIQRDYSELPKVECQAGQFNQVFMNILSNAIDALESTSQPQITIRTSVLGDSVEIAIGDNGIGIPEAIQQRIFNPFFTTKPVGKGTGMGMSISYQLIVEKHHGKLECFSTEGEGTEFLIQIPIRQTA
jgi:signal transduction histidine kinase